MEIDLMHVDVGVGEGLEAELGIECMGVAGGQGHFLEAPVVGVAHDRFNEEYAQAAAASVP